jgi:hypothetical protein
MALGRRHPLPQAIRGGTIAFVMSSMTFADGKSNAKKARSRAA